MNRQQELAIENQKKVFMLAFPKSTFEIRTRLVSGYERMSLVARYTIPNHNGGEIVKYKSWSIGPRGKIKENIL